MTAYEKMLAWFGALVCRMKKRHVWSRAYTAHDYTPELGWPKDDDKRKQCARCGLVVAVKRRLKK